MSKILIMGNSRTNGLVFSKIHYKKKKKMEEKSRYSERFRRHIN